MRGVDGDRVLRVAAEGQEAFGLGLPGDGDGPHVPMMGQAPARRVRAGLLADDGPDEAQEQEHAYQQPGQGKTAKSG